MSITFSMEGTKIPRSKRRYKSDDGFTVVGVLIAASILVVALIPASQLLEKTLGVSASNRSRAIAASIATSVLELDRALGASNFSEFVSANFGTTSTTQVVNGSTYTVKTLVSWSSGTFSSGSCGTTSSKTYNQPVVEVGVTVSWTGSLPSPPQYSSEILTPPVGAYSSTSGNISIGIFNALGGGSAGVSVVATSGTSTTTAVTDQNGCAFFPFLPVGTYSISLPSSLNAGYVDNTNNPSPSATAGVTLGNTTSLQFQYDKGALISLSDANALQVASKFGLTIGNSALPVGGATTLNGSSNPFGPTFPFSSGYQIWLGSCYSFSGTPQFPQLSQVPITTVTAGGTTSITPTYTNGTFTATTSGLPASGYTVDAVPVADASGTSCANSTPVAIGVANGSGTLQAPIPVGYFEFQLIGTSGSVVSTTAPMASNGGAASYAVGN
ncbi:MAG: hypothetical protein M0T78_00695 [Actinomycetota bacterium]|nr:hypothetical protein [Actinomycetota bacterium]